MQILYCRVGWMNSYRGNATERPRNGGSYNKHNIGHEVYNYLGLNGEYYGFVEPGVNSSIHVDRLCDNKKAESADDILIVWVSRKPSGGQYIVGWYKNATVYRNLQEVPGSAMEIRNLKDHNFYNVYSNSDVVLLEVEKRTFRIDGMGHSNIWYGNEDVDSSVIDYIEKYDTEYETRIQKIEKDLPLIEGGEKEAYVKIRINQDKFREGLLSRFNSKCCLCGVNNKKLLFASHIKPWSKSDSYEKLDLANGLLLCPNHDKLFDSGLISFDEKGNIVISESLDITNRIFLNVNDDMKIELSEDNYDYIKYHRENVFQK